MKVRMEQISAQLAELKSRTAATETSSAAGTLARVEALPAAAPAEAVVAQTPGGSATATPTKVEKIVPFSDWDWTWLNGNPRNKDTAFDSKFFTPEIRADITYNYDFNKPIDNSMGGSSELFRSNEIQLEQLGIAFFPAEPLLCFRSGQSRLTIPYFNCLQTHKYEFSNAHIQRVTHLIQLQLTCAIVD